MIKDFLASLKSIFNRIDYSGKFCVIDIAKYLVYLSVKKGNIDININQLIQLLYLVQREYLKEKGFALFKEDFIFIRCRLLIKEINDYFCGFGIMNLIYIYPNLEKDCNISKDYQIELETLFKKYIDKIKKEEFDFGNYFKENSVIEKYHILHSKL